MCRGAPGWIAFAIADERELEDGQDPINALQDFAAGSAHTRRGVWALATGITFSMSEWHLRRVSGGPSEIR